MIRIKISIFIACLIFLSSIPFVFREGTVHAAADEYSRYRYGINVVLDDNYPPYVFRDSNGNLQGILVDQWMLWQKKTGIKVTLHGMDWGIALQRMKAGEFDVIDTVFFNEERAKYLDFSKAYTDIQVPIFFHKNISGIADIESLKGFKIGVKAGDNVIGMLKAKGVDSLVEYNSYEAIIKAAKNQEMVVFVVDKPPGLYYLYKYGIQDEFNISNPLYTGSFHRCVLKGNTKLLNVIENGFSSIAKGEYTQIDRKWIGTPQLDQKTLERLVVVLTIFVVFVLLLFVWNLTLDRKVKSRTAMLSDAMVKLRESEEKNRNLLTNLNVGVAVISREGKLLEHNQKFKELLFINGSFPVEIYVDDLNKRLVMEKDSGVLDNRIFTAVKPLHDYTVGVRNPESGEVVWVKTDVEPELDKQGNVVKTIITAVDITGRKKAELALRESESRLSAFLKAIPDIFFLMDKEGRIIDFSTGNPYLLYVSPAEFLGKSVKEIFDGDISRAIIAGIERLQATGETQTVEYYLDIKGEKNFFEARLVLCGDEKILALVRDVTERKHSETRLRELSIMDTPTGIYNRNYFENVLDSHQAEDFSGVGIVICDIDGLKMINDTLGHAAGDDFLKAVAEVLKQCFRKEDIIARIGGDEFAILMKDTSEEEIASIKHEVMEMLDKLNFRDNIIPTSMSMGYAAWNGSQKELRELMKTADNWMYREKLHHRLSEKSKNIDILMKMLEARDFITEGHGERMQELCCKLAKAAGMQENEIKDIGLFAQFHDIGKVGIPDRILYKPGKLTEGEMEEMKRHTEIGYRIAEASPDLMHIADWVLKHHEWWNGKGYPFGLKGEEIPLQCRILSIIDAFDAMTSSRPYKNALSPEAAVEEIMKFKGSQFDPRLVDRFVEIVRSAEK